MKALRIISIVVASIFAMLIIGLIVAYRVSNTVPGRPAGVSSDAVFLWAPYVGFPRPRNGSWMSCRKQNENHIDCVLSAMNGASKYRGAFVPYYHKAVLNIGPLPIDPAKTRDDSVWIKDELVPLVYLTNGEILVPAEGYQQGQKILDSRHTGH
jgi:hypothetical protein